MMVVWQLIDAIAMKLLLEAMLEPMVIGFVEILYTLYGMRYTPRSSSTV